MLWNFENHILLLRFKLQKTHLLCFPQDIVAYRTKGKVDSASAAAADDDEEEEEEEGDEEDDDDDDDDDE